MGVFVRHKRIAVWLKIWKHIGIKYITENMANMMYYVVLTYYDDYLFQSEI